MFHKNLTDDKSEAVMDIVAAAGGEMIGRTRLQKTAFLLELVDLGSGFHFDYKHYGPYSEELAAFAEVAPILVDFNEEQRSSSWGGAYSVYSTGSDYSGTSGDAKQQIISIAKEADPVELELAATAAFLDVQGFDDPWGETERRKPEKTRDGRIDRAKILFLRLRDVETIKSFPDI